MIDDDVISIFLILKGVRPPVKIRPSVCQLKCWKPKADAKCCFHYTLFATKLIFVSVKISALITVYIYLFSIQTFAGLIN